MKVCHIDVELILPRQMFLFLSIWFMKTASAHAAFLFVGC